MKKDVIKNSLVHTLNIGIGVLKTSKKHNIESINPKDFLQSSTSSNIKKEAPEVSIPRYYYEARGTRGSYTIYDRHTQEAMAYCNKHWKAIELVDLLNNQQNTNHN